MFTNKRIIKCNLCDDNADIIYDMNPICNSCLSQNEIDKELISEIKNSPRTGVCGY